MNINELASKYANTHGGDIVPPCTGLTSDALSEVLKPMMVENSDTGVSTRNALSATHPPLHSTFQTDNSHWYALRTTYGREKKAYDYIISKGGTACLSAINAENQQIIKQTPNFTPKNVKLGVFILFKTNHIRSENNLIKNRTNEKNNQFIFRKISYLCSK